MHHRILFGLSLSDIVGSIAYSLSTLPSPSGTPGIWGARGNKGTCTAQGFFINAGFSVLYYNAALMLHYLLAISFNISEAKAKKIFEPWVHLFIFSVAVIPGIVGAFMGMFNNSGNICFFGPYPKDCLKSEEIECERGENYFLFFALSSGWLILLVYIALPISLSYLLWTLWKQERMMNQKYQFRLQNVSLERSSSLHTNFSINSSKTRSKSSKRSTRLKKVRSQSICYVAALFLCFTWPIFLYIAPKIGSRFPMRCLTQFFYPLQGFFNFLNFIRPCADKLIDCNVATSWPHAMYLVTFKSGRELKRRKLQMRSKSDTRETPSE